MRSLLSALFVTLLAGAAAVPAAAAQHVHGPSESANFGNVSFPTSASAVQPVLSAVALLHSSGTRNRKRRLPLLRRPILLRHGRMGRGDGSVSSVRIFPRLPICKQAGRQSQGQMPPAQKQRERDYIASMVLQNADKRPTPRALDTKRQCARFTSGILRMTKPQFSTPSLSAPMRP
jgi:hypothetical protein